MAKKVLHYVSSMDRGGEETFIMNVFRNIDDECVRFGFLYTEPKLGAYADEIYHLGGKAYHVTQNRIGGKIKQLDNYFLLKKKLKELSISYDCFHIHTQHAMDAYISSLAAIHAGFKHVIVHSHNASTIYSTKTHQVFKQLLHNLDIERFACGNDAGKWMFGNDKFTIIRNGIDLEQFQYNSTERKKIRKKMGWQDKHIIGHIGRFNRQKNHSFLIQAFKKLADEDRNTLLILVGTGELEEKIKHQVDMLGLTKKVQFLGSRSDVSELYQAIDVFALPSLFEGLPVVLVEAQAAGLPCIISDTITEEIDILPTLQRLSLDEGPDAWAEALKRILDEDKDRQNTMVELDMAGYNIKKVALNLQEFYSKL